MITNTLHLDIVSNVKLSKDMKERFQKNVFFHKDPSMFPVFHWNGLYCLIYKEQRLCLYRFNGNKSKDFVKGFTCEEEAFEYLFGYEKWFKPSISVEA